MLMLQQPLTPSVRTSAPALSPEHIRFAQSMPASAASSGASSFLTPVAPSLENMSPPPQQEVDDYFNVHGHSHDVGKHSKKYNNHYDKRGNSYLAPILRSQPTTLSNSDHRICASPSCLSDPLLEPGEQHLSKYKNHKLIDAAPPGDIAGTHSIGSQTNTGQDDDAINSPATSALRRLNQYQPPNPESGARSLRRMSTVLSRTFNILKSRAPTSDSFFSSNNARPADQVPARKVNSQHTIHDSTGRQSPQENRNPSSLPTPSSITLRKASNVYVPDLPRSSMSASLFREDGRMRVPDAPTSELLAFYSTNVKRSEGTRSMSESPSPTSHSPPKSRRHNVLAAPTVTFADIHVAPGTFAVDPKSRKASLISGDQPPRRISVVQFRSRDSVHEVIWREDETPSDSSPTTNSSRTSNSLHHQGQVASPGEHSLVGDIGSAKLLQHQLVPSMSIPTSVAEKLQGGLYKWSWDRPAAPSANAEMKHDCQDEPILSHRRSASYHGLNGHRRTSSALNIRRHSVSEPQGSMTFSPVLNHSSTFDWRKASTVELTETMAYGAQPHLSSEGSTSSKSGSATEHAGIPKVEEAEASGKVAMLREKFSGRVTSSDCVPHARTAQSSRKGSKLGISSHARIPQLL